MTNGIVINSLKMKKRKKHEKKEEEKKEKKREDIQWFLRGF